MSIGEESTFYAEVLNDPTATSSTLWDASKVGNPHSELFTGEMPLGRFIILDPSLGKKKSDTQIAFLVEFWDEKPEVRDFKIFQMSKRLNRPRCYVDGERQLPSGCRIGSIIKRLSCCCA